MGFNMAQTKVMQSRLTGLPTVYSLTQAIAATEPIDYDATVLKNAYNDEFFFQGLDAHVESVKQYRGLLQDNMVVDTWVATTEALDVTTGRVVQLIPPLLIAAIIQIIPIIAFAVAAVVIIAAATAFVERAFPRPKFYAPDGTEFSDLASYLSYMQNISNPAQGKPYTCIYCGQGFATVVERDTHQEQCPWKDGPPGPATPEWMVWAIAGIGIIGLTVVAVTVLKPKKG